MIIHRPKTLGELRAQFAQYSDDTPIALTVLSVTGEVVEEMLEIVYKDGKLTVDAPSPDM